MSEYTVRESWSVETLTDDGRWAQVTGPMAEPAARGRANEHWSAGVRGVRLLRTTRTSVGEKRR